MSLFLFVAILGFGLGREEGAFFSQCCEDLVVMLFIWMFGSRPSGTACLFGPKSVMGYFHGPGGVEVGILGGFLLFLHTINIRNHLLLLFIVPLPKKNSPCYVLARYFGVD